MKTGTAVSIAFALLLAAGTGTAQEDREELKKKILKKVEERLRLEEERLLKELSKIIDEELGRGKKVEPPRERPKTSEPGFLGVHPADLTGEEREALKVVGGVILRRVVPGAPAEKAGLKVGDVILSLDGKKIAKPTDLRDYIMDKGAGSQLQVVYVRDGKERKATVTLGSRHKWVEKEKDDHRGHDHPEKPKGEPTPDELRKRIKKFLEKTEKEQPKKEKKEEKREKKDPRGDGAPNPFGDMLAFDDDTFEQIRGMLEQFGMDPKQFFQKGKDGLWRPSKDLQEMLKQFNFRDMLPQAPERKRPSPPKKKGAAEGVYYTCPMHPAVRLPKMGDCPVCGMSLLMKKTSKEVLKEAWVGIVPVELTAEERKEAGVKAGIGVRIVEVLKESPAKKAGLEVGDILLRIDGKDLLGLKALGAFVATARPGKKHTFTLLRKKKEWKVEVTLAERKD